MSRDIRKIVDSYLRDGMEIEVAAQQLIEFFDSPAATENEEIDEEWKCQPLYQVIIGEVKGHNQDDPKQDSIVDLLQELKTRGGPGTSWNLLSPLGMHMREIWTGPTEHGPAPWTRLNSFTARLTARQLLDFDAYGIWAMRTPLEDFRLADEPGEGEWGAEFLEISVPAAAMWIFYAGERMWRLGFEEREWPKMMKGGPRWQGRPGFSQQRWQLWKARFGDLGHRDDLSEQTLMIARRAHEKMTEIDSAKVENSPD